MPASLAERGAAGPVLAILTSVYGARDGERLVLDIKAMDGLYLYARHWPGPVLWMLSLRDLPPSYSRPVDPATLPFQVVEVAEDRSDVAAKLPAGAILLAAADNSPDLALAAALPGQVAYILEYTLRTRIDILRVDDRSLPRKVRGLLWQLTTERKRLRALRAAIGLQCNGLPAYRRYASIAARPIYYFDTRLSQAQLPSPGDFAARKARLLSGAPLRLAFSGRIDRMKGADYLVPLAHRLKAEGLDFVFEIFGTGALTGDLEAAAAGDLRGHLILNGAVPFDEALVPAMKSRIDLFVCPHPQGDPSCSYLETLGCGVPIVGFANEAWVSMAEGQPFGAIVPISDVAALARKIMALDRDRASLVAMSEAAMAFAGERTFEALFAARVAHLRECAAAMAV